MNDPSLSFINACFLKWMRISIGGSFGLFEGEAAMRPISKDPAFSNDGRCKHIAAVLIAFERHPEWFRETTGRDLSGRDRESFEQEA